MTRGMLGFVRGADGLETGQFPEGVGSGAVIPFAKPAGICGPHVNGIGGGQSGKNFGDGFEIDRMFGACTSDGAVGDVILHQIALT